ncbi:MAG TPA: protein kinase [Thermoanaerobaculia bacterium]|nr:protein kinase [Thermoanaerobaculia bacterium]
MSFPAGMKLGPYEILSPIGAGGMGEVYRAKDPRLGRDVAIKVLPASFSSDPDRLKRFEQEARAAGVLNHPNVTIVYDIGTNTSDGAPYVVQELLEGETLRAELSGGRFSPRKSIDYAVQIAQGLAAAHDKGIVHRDLKPENLFVTKEGRVKILDFGLAKLTQPEGSAASTNIPTATEPGVVMGTLGYMSPEQVKARPADARSDIFALGAILYEMLSGQRAFRGDSAGETMASILKEDPPDLSVTNQNVSPGLERIVRHCLEKNPERRFQSASDIAFNLESLSSVPAGSGAAALAVPAGPRSKRTLGVVFIGLAILAAGFLAASWAAGRGDGSFPKFRRITYRRGYVSNARFAPDGQTIIYSADWDGEPPRIFSTRPDSRESTPLALPSASLLAVSSRGEMAILLDPKVDYNLYFRRGTLAVVPLAGGSPREVEKDVRWADWSPDGKALAIVRQERGRQKLEYPPGRLLYDSTAWISGPRISPGGDRIFFYEGLPFNGYWLTVLDLQKRKSVLGPIWADFWTSGWSPDGDEIWIPASMSGEGAETPLIAFDLSGRQRMLYRGPFTADLDDVSADGRALVTLYLQEERARGLVAGHANETQLTGRTDLRLVDLSSDGELFALRDAILETEGQQAVWVARADGSLPIRLGEGVTQGISADGASVLASEQGKLVALPTGAGSVKPVSDGFFEAIRWASWFPDGKRVLVWGQEKGGKTGIFAVDPGAPPRRVAPEGFELVSGGNAVSPDGLRVAARSPDDQMMVCPVDGGTPQPIPGLTGLYVPIQWSDDGRHLYVFRLGELPTKVMKVDVQNGVATLWKELAPPDTSGVTIRAIAMTPDAKYYAYSCQSYQGTLCLLDNLQSWRRPGFWSRLFGRR